MPDKEMKECRVITSSKSFSFPWGWLFLPPPQNQVVSGLDWSRRLMMLNHLLPWLSRVVSASVHCCFGIEESSSHLLFTKVLSLSSSRPSPNYVDDGYMSYASFSMSIYPEPKPLYRLHFFRSILTIKIHVLFGLPLFLGGPSGINPPKSLCFIYLFIIFFPN